MSKKLRGYYSEDQLESLMIVFFEFIYTLHINVRFYFCGMHLLNTGEFLSPIVNEFATLQLEYFYCSAFCELARRDLILRRRHCETPSISWNFLAELFCCLNNIFKKKSIILCFFFKLIFHKY